MIAYQEVYNFGTRGNRASGAFGDIFKDLLGHGEKVLDMLTGQGAAREAQQVQLALAKAQQDRLAAQTQARSEALASFSSAAPWIVLGVGAIVLGVVVLKK